jgi:hypothetical protein
MPDDCATALVGKDVPSVLIPMPLARKATANAAEVRGHVVETQALHRSENRAIGLNFHATAPMRGVRVGRL